MARATSSPCTRACIISLRTGSRPSWQRCRILRPSGVFLVREHDATPELIPMLDMAHSIFNAVTGVSLADERVEIRARPILEWRGIIESAGFVDTMVYEMEKGDPTLDEMMAFVKPVPPTVGGGIFYSDRTTPSRRHPLLLGSVRPRPLALALHASAPPPTPPSMPPQVSMLLDSGPPALLDFLRAAQAALNQALPQRALPHRAPRGGGRRAARDAHTRSGARRLRPAANRGVALWPRPRAHAAAARPRVAAATGGGLHSRAALPRVEQRATSPSS